jgi:energy-coupling factor transporter ATP-binding protein EcfA2
MPTSTTSLAVSIVAPRAAENDLVLLTSAMPALALDPRHPLALEIAGTPARKSFVLRASTPEALDHAVSQLRARYPQALLLPVSPENDPFRLDAGEAVSALELVAGAAPSQPLRVFEDRELAEAGIDPLLGLLAAVENLPPETRAVAQLAMAPAAPNWSRAYQRQALEHALESERQQRLLTREGSGPSWLNLLLMAAALGVVVLLQQVHGLIPEWLLQAGGQLLKGKPVHFTAGEQAQLLIGGIALFIGAFLFFVVVDQAKKRLFPRQLYDQRLVQQKTRGPAYRVRLRLYVIGPGEQASRQAVPSIWVMLRQWSLSLRRLPTTVQQAWRTARADLARMPRRHLRQREMPGSSEGPWPAVLARLLERTALEAQRTFLSGMQRWFRRAQDAWKDGVQRRARAKGRRAVLLQFVAAYRQFHLASGGYFLPRRLSARKAKQCLRGAWWRDVASSAQLLSMETLANLWHLPPASMLPSLALVESHSARSILMPPGLSASQGEVIGSSEHAGHQLPVPLLPELLTMHGLVAGKTGEGKSTFMQHLAGAAMREGGLVVIDPHGDLAEHILLQVPEARADDVVFIDLSDPTAAFGLNPIDVMLGRERDKAVADLLKTFAHIWASSWGPRMENAFRAALRTLYEANLNIVARDAQEGPHQQYTLLDVLPVLTRESFCHALLQHIKDPWLHRWWREYFEPLNLYMQRDIVNPILSKTTQFEGAIARRIVGQSSSTLNFSAFIRERKIILVKLAKGVVGNDVAVLLGATLLGLLQTTLEEQGALAEHERARLMVILDEFQVLAGVDYGALAELRKYGATFALATQSLEYLQKLDPVLLPTVLANVKHLTTFQLSARDAFTIHQELGVAEEDITNLNSYMCYARWTSGGQRQPTFSLTLQLPTAGASTQAEHIRLRSRARYAVSITIVEARLEAAMKRNSTLTQPRPATASEAQETVAASSTASDIQPVGGQATKAAASQKPPASPAPKREDRGRKAEQQKPPKTDRGRIVPMELLTQVRETDSNDAETDGQIP